MDPQLVKFAADVVELASGFDRYVEALEEVGCAIEANIYKEATANLEDAGEVMLKKAAVMQRVMREIQ